MLDMDKIHEIRRIFYEDGEDNIAEIARMTGVNRKTVEKYIDKVDFSEKPPEPLAMKVRPSKLDPFKPLIDSWLIADKKAPRKQRHTAKRVYRRLKEEHRQ